MKIISLKAENFKKLSAVEITPEGNVVQITGKNEAGKSSVLDAIEAALKGRAGHRDTIKKGAEKGKIVLDLQDFTITRSFTAENQYLKVETKDGFERKSPQKFLDELMGSISFDPLNFINTDAKKQRQILLEFSGLDLDSLDKQYSEIYSERTLANRIQKDAEALYNDARSFPEIQNARISVSALLSNLNDIKDTQKALEERRAKVATAKAEVATISESIKYREAKIEELKNQINDLVYDIDNFAKRRATLEIAIEKAENQIRFDAEKEDCETKIEVLTQQIEGAEATNQKVDLNIKKAELKQKLSEANKKVFDLNQKLTEIETKKKTAIAEAKLPIEGLGFTADAVTFNGITIAELSSAQKIRVGLAISMALNPKLRVLRITDGSLLDSDSMKIISEMTAKNDFQVWIERVDETGKVGFFIEDGALKQ